MLMCARNSVLRIALSVELWISIACIAYTGYTSLNVQSKYVLFNDLIRCTGEQLHVPLRVTDKNVIMMHTGIMMTYITTLRMDH